MERMQGKFALAVLSALLLAMPHPSAGQAPVSVEARASAGPITAEVRAQALRTTATIRAQSRQERLTELSQTAIDAALGPSDQVPRKIGFARRLSGAAATVFPRGTDWHVLPDGAHVAAMTVSAPRAAALRLALEVDQLPDAAELRFYSADLTEVHVVRATAVNALIRRNLAAGDSPSAASTYWSPVVEGASIGLEVYLPAGERPDLLRLAVPTVSHLVSTPRTVRQEGGSLQSAGSCNLDVNCYSAWSPLQDAVARMVFTKSGSSYLCTGTLLNDQAGSGTPYFLTANHCISGQTVASTLTTWWFYRSTSCGSSFVNPGATTRSGGAVLLATSSATDGTLLQLLDTPPAGAMYSGWSTSVPLLFASNTGIHHPQGDLKKISFGYPTDYYSCTASGGSSFTCTSATSQTGNYLGVQWTEGVTEGGSSGSGLFLNSGQYLTGTLYGGSGTCANLTRTGYYGRFDRFFALGNLGQWLSLAVDYALTVSKTGSGGGVVTSAPVGIDCGASCSAGFSSSTTVTLTATPAVGSVFAGWAGDCAGAQSSCMVSMTSARSVTARFNRARHDFTGDGTSDIPWRHVTGGDLYLWIMRDGALAEHGSMGSADLSWRVAIGDVDGDGRADIVWRNALTGQNLVWLMNGRSLKEALSLPAVTDLNWKIAAMADIDGDGREDILWRHEAGGMFAVWLMGPSGYVSGKAWGDVPGSWELRGAADFTGDGRADLIWREKASGSVAIYHMSGLTVAGAYFLAGGLSEWDITAVMDLDQDGRAEILFRYFTGSAHATVDLDSAGTAVMATSFQPAPGLAWKIDAVADYDGDGKPDYLWRSTAGDLALWLDRDPFNVRYLSSPGPDWGLAAR